MPHLHIVDALRIAECKACALLLLSTFVLGGCNDQKEVKPVARQTVSIAQPVVATVNRYLYTTGTTKAVKAVDLMARVMGTLNSIDYQDGRTVKAGERLFLIEQEQYQAQLDQSAASVQQAQATLTNAQAQFDRQNQLSTSQATAQTNVDAARGTRDTASGQLAAAQAALTVAKINLSYTAVTAPFEGIVTEHQADVGALVGTNGPTKLASIVQLDPIDVSFSISDHDMLQIRKQMRDRNATFKDIGAVRVDVGTQIDSDYPHSGKLDYASPESESDTGTLSARAVFDNHEKALLPGLFVRIRIPIETVKDALFVPPSAIGSDQQGRYVLTVNSDSKVERHAVTLLDQSGDLQQVAGKLASSDWIVTNALSSVGPGSSVETQKVVIPVQAPASTASTDTSSN